MPWQNLAEDLEEEFSGQGFDIKDGLRWIRPLADPESRKNYDRWYWNQVWYPKNKQKYLQQLRDKYREIMANPELRAKFRKRKAAWERANGSKGTKRHEKRMEQQRKRYAKMMADPVAHAKYLERKRAYAHAAKQRKNGQKTSGSSGE